MNDSKCCKIDVKYVSMNIFRRKSKSSFIEIKCVTKLQTGKNAGLKMYGGGN